MLYFNTNVGATLYRTIRGGASATVEKARRVERMNAADRAERAVDSRQVERLEREIAGVEARLKETDDRVRTAVDERIRQAVGRRWEMCSTVPNPGFVRPDEPVLVTSAGGGGWRLIYPMTPDYCFVAGPDGAETPRPVVPHVRAIDEHGLSQLNLQLAASSRRTVIARHQNDDSALRALLAPGMRRRTFRTRGSSDEFWGRIRN